jgi:hypothetical protein
MGSGCRRALRVFSTRVGVYTYHNALVMFDADCDSMISYPNYKFIFPIKALGMYARRFDEGDTNGVA